MEDIRSLRNQRFQNHRGPESGSGAGELRRVRLCRNARAGGDFEQDWDQVMDVHAKATFFCCRLIGRMIDRTATAKSSISAPLGHRVRIWARASHGFAKGWYFTISDCRALHRMGAVRPAARKRTGSDFYPHGECQPHFPGKSRARAATLLSRIKIGRFADPSDLVGAAIFLASPPRIL